MAGVFQAIMVSQWSWPCEDSEMCLEYESSPDSGRVDTDWTFPLNTFHSEDYIHTRHHTNSTTTWLQEDGSETLL